MGFYLEKYDIVVFSEAESFC